MKANLYFFIGIILLATIPAVCQIEGWSNLKALESNREEVEKIIGSPRKYFETYGVYDTSIGKFHIWYSKGGCHKEIEGFQYKVPAQKMTRLWFEPNKPLSLESYISDRKDYIKSEAPFNSDSFLFKSPDGSAIYNTILPNDAEEFVLSIEIQPGNEKKDLICKENEKK